MKSTVCEKVLVLNSVEAEREISMVSDGPKLEAARNGGEYEELNERRGHLNGCYAPAVAAGRMRDAFPAVAAASNGATRRNARPEMRDEDDAWFRVLFEHLPEPVFLLDPHDPRVHESIVECSQPAWQQDGVTHEFAWSLDWPILECNRAACLRHGYPQAELAGQPARLVGPLTTRPEDLVNLLRKLAVENYARFQAMNRCKDGTLFPVEISTSRITLGGREKLVVLSRDISHWKQAETEYGKLAGFARHYPHPLVEFNAQGQVVYYNAAALELARSLNQRTFSAILPANCAREVKECLALKKERLTLETKLSGKTVRWSFCPLPVEQMVFAYAIDFSGWIRVEDVPASVENANPDSPAPPANGHARNREVCPAIYLGEHSVAAEPKPEPEPEAELCLDASGIIWSVNPAMEKLTGQAARAIAGQRITDLTPDEPGVLAWWLDACDQIFSGREPGPGEMVWLRADKSEMLLEVQARAILNDDRPEGVRLILRDVTKQKQTELAWRKREARLALVQKVARIGSWELDAAGGGLDWSDEMYRIFKRNREAFVPTREAFCELVEAGMRDEVRRVREQAAQKGTGYTVEYKLAQPEGPERCVFEQAEAVTGADGRVARVVGTVQDISGRKQQEEQSRHVEKWEAIGRMAGGVAHDFNGILTDIRRCTELLQASPNVNGELAPQLKQLKLAAERATNLTWQLLSLSRKQTASPDLLDLNNLINAATGVLQHVLQPDIVLDLHLAAKLPQVPAHPDMLEQVLLNLAINSRNAMPRGGRLVVETRDCEIDATYVQEQPEAKVGRYVCLRVSDNGGGVNAARMSCLHEPFFTTKNVGQGTGLGLATIQGIVKQHQGWIDVSSDLERGTTFRVYLPVNPGKSDLLAAERLHRPIAGGSETILLVESEPLMRALARSILQRYGYQIVEAGSAEEARTVWSRQSKQIGLLLTEMGAPEGVNGLELAQQLQAGAPNLKVLFASGHSAGLTQSGRKLKPGLNFLPKPYSATALAQAVRSCLDRAEGGEPKN